ncbi:MAG: hypothetical protein AAGA66_12695 [Bacteroidota bacterium]
MKARLFLPFLLLSIACETDETTSSLTSSEASRQLDRIADELSSDIVSFAQSEGLEAMTSFIDLLNTSTTLGRLGYQRKDGIALAKQQVALINQYFVLGIANLLEGGDDFWDNKGIYEWRFDSNEFELIRTSDTLAIAFPLEESNINNAEFRISEITFKTIDSEEYPTLIKATMTINDPEEAPFKAINLDFSSEFEMDDSLDKVTIALDVLPFSLTLALNDSQSSTSSLFSQLLLNGENIKTIDASITFDSAEKLEPALISGMVSYRSLQLIGSVDDEQLRNSEDGDPNDYIDLDVYIQESKAGHVFFLLEDVVEDGILYTDYIAYIQYEDGETEKLEDIMEPVLNELDELAEELEFD